MYFVTLEDEANGDRHRIVAELEIEHFFNTSSSASTSRSTPGSTIVYQEDLNILISASSGRSGSHARRLVAGGRESAPAHGAQLDQLSGVPEACGAADASLLRSVPNPHPPGGQARCGAAVTCLRRTLVGPVSPPMTLR
jgi:hypothetical protein